ncbi:hypothetical protein LSAT2_012931 [Lamellibrachia satsuma]|nr:hypothetical protein LSAT2_012931 [Lamellibrachia satsuma]
MSLLQNKRLGDGVFKVAAPTLWNDKWRKYLEAMRRKKMYSHPLAASDDFGLRTPSHLTLETLQECSKDAVGATVIEQSRKQDGVTFQHLQQLDGSLVDYCCDDRIISGTDKCVAFLPELHGRLFRHVSRVHGGVGGKCSPAERS